MFIFEQWDFSGAQAKNPEFRAETLISVWNQRVTSIHNVAREVHFADS